MNSAFEFDDAYCSDVAPLLLMRF